jgi:hypothetical protein
MFWMAELSLSAAFGCDGAGCSLNAQVMRGSPMNLATSLDVIRRGAHIYNVSPAICGLDGFLANLPLAFLEAL